MIAIFFNQNTNNSKLVLVSHTEYGSTCFITVQEFENCIVEFNKYGVVIIRDTERNFLFTGIVPVIYE